MAKDMRQFLQLVKEKGSDFYVEVKKPLKPKLEPSIIQHKLADKGHFPVIYCPTIEGSKLPLVTSLFGSYELLGLAIDIDPKTPKSLGKAYIAEEYRRRSSNLLAPQIVQRSEAPVKEVVLRGKDVDLGLLPIIHHNELDSGKYIPIGSCVCVDPDTGIPNTGVYRHEVKSKNQLGCYINPGHNGSYIARRYAELGKPMEVVLFIGHHPAVTMGSIAEVDLNTNEFEVMGGLLGEPIQLTPAETVDLPVPAYAEIAIEGVIDTSKWVTDAPFAEYTGYYGMQRQCYLIQVTGITMRKDAIYHDLDSGHREHNLSGVLGFETNIYDAVKRAVPSVKAVHLPPSGCCAYHAYISIKKGVQGEGKRAGLAAISGWNDFRVAVVVDEDIDVFNEEEVLWAVATRVDGAVDISIIPHVTGPGLHPYSRDEAGRIYDEAGRRVGHMTSKIVVDATKPVELPFPVRATPSKDLLESMKLEDYITWG